MITKEQIKAARAMLDWSQKDLAERTGGAVSQPTIKLIEKGMTAPRQTTLDVIRSTFEKNGIEFLGYEGIRIQHNHLQVFSGEEGFRNFMDDVYEVAKEYGGDICLFNSKPSMWYKWLGEEWYKMHAQRMKDLGDRIRVRITVQEGEDFFILGSAEHRWFTKAMWKERMFYAYGPKLAFLDFSNDNVKITVLDQLEFTESFRALFDLAWDNAKKVKNNKKG